MLPAGGPGARVPPAGLGLPALGVLIVDGAAVRILPSFLSALVWGWKPRRAGPSREWKLIQHPLCTAIRCPLRGRGACKGLSL